MKVIKNEAAHLAGLIKKVKGKNKVAVLTGLNARTQVNGKRLKVVGIAISGAKVLLTFKQGTTANVTPTHLVLTTEK